MRVVIRSGCQAAEARDLRSTNIPRVAMIGAVVLDESLPEWSSQTQALVYRLLWGGLNVAIVSSDVQVMCQLRQGP